MHTTQNPVSVSVFSPSPLHLSSFVMSVSRLLHLPCASVALVLCLGMCSCEVVTQDYEHSKQVWTRDAIVRAYAPACVRLFLMFGPPPKKQTT